METVNLGIAGNFRLAHYLSCASDGIERGEELRQGCRQIVSKSRNES